MGLHYFSSYDFITKKTFDVLVPAFYQSHIPDSIRNAKPEPFEKPNPFRAVSTARINPAPFYTIFDPDRLQMASYTVEIMIDMFTKKVEFQIVNDVDVVEIMDGLDAYLMSIKSDVEIGNEATIAFARMSLNWREELYKHYYRYMKTNKLALDNLYPNNDPSKNLMSLMATMTTREETIGELDPLLAKANPPYRVDAIIPKDAQSKEQGYVESYLNNASDTFMNDSANKFDLEEFLKRG